MTFEMRTLSDAEVDQVAGGGAGLVVAALAVGFAVGLCCGTGLGVGSVVAGGAARQVSEGGGEQPDETETGDTGETPPE